VSTQNVHVRVNDADTGRPTPVRIRFTDAAGNYYAPLGRLTHFSTVPNQDVGGNVLVGGRAYAYIDGTCEIPLSTAAIDVEIHKGPEYEPVYSRVELAPGKLALRFVVHRTMNSRAERWYAGDARAHFLSPHAALLEGAAEDLAVVNLLIKEHRVADPLQGLLRTFPNIVAFSGRHGALKNDTTIVVVNTLNAHPILGSLSLLNCHRLVFPLSFGGADRFDDWSLAAWCDQCHRKNGLVVWANTAHEADLALGEPLADLILGKVDAFEIDSPEDSPLDVLKTWYMLLDAGIRVPLVGASGKESNGEVLGTMRTYARLAVGQEFSYASWIEAVRAGRTFVSNSPLLQFTIDGMDPGSTLSCTAGSLLHVQATATSHMPFDRLELVINGKVAAFASGSGAPCTAMLRHPLEATKSAWVALRCRAEHVLLDEPPGQRVFAHTSPIYIDVAGQPFRPDEGAQSQLAQQLDNMLRWTRREARVETDKQREALARIFSDARRRLEDERA
jgi:hypothetical protein